MPFKAGLQLKCFCFYKWNVITERHKALGVFIILFTDDPKYGHLESYANGPKLGRSGRSGRIWRPTFSDSMGQI